MAARRFLRLPSRRSMTSSCLTSTTFSPRRWHHWYCFLHYQSLFVNCKHQPPSRWLKPLHSHSLWMRQHTRGLTHFLHPSPPPHLQENCHCSSGANVHRAQHKLSECYSRADQFITRTSLTGPTSCATATIIASKIFATATATTSIQILLSRRGCNGTSGHSIPDKVVLNWAYSGRMRGPHPRSRPLTYPPPVMPTPASLPIGIYHSRFGVPKVLPPRVQPFFSQPPPYDRPISQYDRQLRLYRPFTTKTSSAYYSWEIPGTSFADAGLTVACPIQS